MTDDIDALVDWQLTASAAADAERDFDTRPFEAVADMLRAVAVAITPLQAWLADLRRAFEQEAS